ncbi:hypothetical protein FOFC_02616 [Fusarium oxysporum]|nr:hypothetical protein FOFC_02616 [Fusarium oxysporum]
MWRMLLMACMGGSNAKSRRSKSSKKRGLRLGQCTRRKLEVCVARYVERPFSRCKAVEC